MNKLSSNTHTVTSAEQIYTRLQSKSAAVKPTGPEILEAGKKPHVDLAAG
jgi:hypothetical protein